ncbi:MAG TPA: FAD-linked oxidase C-terminal domain-containing protein [Gemmatimonadaceae bacterium]|nr:FAD-linked oxidase C-terminal domain-containing protein [Gemmatimonadaceae bacterium]
MTRIPQMPVSRRTGKGQQAPPPTPPRPDAVSGRDLHIDVPALEKWLRSDVRGEVRFNDGDRALYSTDASNYRQLPVGVVVPRSADDVVATVAACRAFGAPIMSRGGATDLAGATCNAAVVMDLSKYMNRVLEINWDEKWARVEPGTVLDDLRHRAEERSLTFGPDPATHARNTLGGMIGNNSCGMHAQMAGKVEENTLSLDVLTYDGERMRVGPTSEDELESIIGAGGVRGEIYSRLKVIRDTYGDQIRAKFPKIPRLVSGYALHQLLPEHGFNVARALVGTESTCVTVLEAKLRLVHSPRVRTLVVVAYDDIFTAGDHVAFCNEFKPIALEGIDASMFKYMHDKGMSTSGRKLFPNGGAWLVVEFGGDTKAEAAESAHKLMSGLEGKVDSSRVKLFEDVKQEHLIWHIREAGLGSTSKIPHDPDFYPGWEDSAVGPEDVGNYLRDLQKLFDRYGYTASLYGHFGQGCVHCSIDFDLYTPDGITRWTRFLNEAAHLVTSYGGSLSGEHGDGQARGSLLPIMFGDELVQAFREFKAAWDPRGMMNPGKVVDAYPVDRNLRWGPHYHPWDPATHFAFTEDRGSFAYAANRCVGTGKCRKHDSGTMCPSYMVTREEKHSTRGRSRLLFEMLEGNPLGDGWRDESVKDALDLCLACKACRGECPVNVDMATYKAEFLSHYYDGHRRPLSAYAFGLMHRWARLAAHAPRFANFFTQTPGLRSLAKAAVSIAPERRIPPFARRTFRHWFKHRKTPNPSSTPVVLWVDTWNNYFLPDTARAAVQVLEAAGFQVVVPQRPLCCGRPLYDYGMLGTAKKLLRETLDALGPHLRAGTSVVGLEPSCVSVFRDELTNILPNDDDAKRLHDQSFMLGEFLAEHLDHLKLPPMHRKAVVHGHCHAKSILKFDSQSEVLKAAGLEFTVLDSGCCGMAGAFGYEKGEHYDVSVACGERVLLPAVRQSARDALILADGFSCREQIVQTTGVRALHLADALKMSLDQRSV